MTGVLALQGDFAAHLRMLAKTSSPAKEVRTIMDLAGCDRLILPGGESTTLNILLELTGLDGEIHRRAREGMPVWGTCMGMILMAKEIEGRDQRSLELLDITVQRNAFGSQVWSFEAVIKTTVFDEPVSGVFIRAPVVTRCGKDVEPIAEYQNEIVAVRSGSLLGTSFHPELTDDSRLHSWFLTFSAVP